MGKRAQHDDSWRWIPSSVPKHAMAPLRELVEDKSTWKGLEFWNGVPLSSQPTLWQWLWGAKRRSATATFDSAELMTDDFNKEFAGITTVAIRWKVTGARPVEIDTDAAMKYLDEQQLRDSGWSEGAMQTRFGPPIVCNEAGERCRQAQPQEILRDGLTSRDNGRYTMMLTLQGRGTNVYAW
jgi:hypothetical protein